MELASIEEEKLDEEAESDQQQNELYEEDGEIVKSKGLGQEEGTTENVEGREGHL